jgi:vacuolar-type H+-ATPase subunit H
MGLFDEIKKAVWAAKSVGKQAGKKASQKAEETVEGLGKDVQGLGDQLVKGGKEAMDAAKEFIEDAQRTTKRAANPSDDKLDLNPETNTSGKSAGEKFGDAINSAKETAKPYVDQAKKAAEPYVEKAKEFTEEVGKEVMDKGGKVVNKAADVAEDLGGKVMEFGDILKDKAIEVGSKLKDQGQAFFDKAQEEAAKQQAKDDLIDKAVQDQANKDHQRALDEMAKKAENLNESGNAALDNIKKTPGLDGFDDFFSKAARFADGDYHNKGEEKPEVSIDKSKKQDRPKHTGKLTNFSDNDGDGDELIDDAIIED